MKYLDILDAHYPQWHAERACLDPEPFDHDQHPTLAISKTGGCGMCEAAKQICSSCPVRARCLAAALEEEAQPSVVRAMIRGGLTPGERRELAKESAA